MQHDHVLKKLNFDFFLPPPCLERGWGSFSFVQKHDFHVDDGKMIVTRVKLKEISASMV